MLLTIYKTEKITIDTETQQIVSSEVSTSVVAPTAQFSEPIPEPKLKKIKTTPVIEEQGEPEVKLEDGKVCFNKAAADILGLVPGARVVISYHQEENGTFTPVIGIQEKMGDSVNGNKLTKGLTFLYKGKQFDTLSLYGNTFKLNMLPDGTAKMIDDSACQLTDITEDQLVPVPVLDELSKTPVKSDDLELNFPGNFEKPGESITFDFDFSTL